MTFVFFDTETTGLQAGFDQIVHFAAVRTDENLQELERFEIRSRLLPHIVPHPTALQINRLPIARLTDPNLPSHYEMVGAIWRKLRSWSPSIFVGFNSIKFDEEMLRHAFFQTLNPPYLTGRHGNCRADALGLMLAAATFAPACLNFPLAPDGRPIFRLQALAQANGIQLERAHDAMADVLATIQLCFRVKERAPEVWPRFARFSQKATVSDFVDAEDGFVLTEFFGNQAYHAPVVCLGPDPHQSNKRLCLDLRVDAAWLSGLSDIALRQELGRKPSPIRQVGTNTAPVLTEIWDAPPTLIGGLNIEEAEACARRLKGDPQFRARLISAYVDGRVAWPVSPHIEKRIYNGFPGPADDARSAQFQHSAWRERAAIVQAFDDDRLKAFGRRIIFEESRSELPGDIRLEESLRLCDRLLEDRGGPLTLRQALEETDRLLDAELMILDSILTEYRSYLLARIGLAERFRADHAARASAQTA